MQALALSLLVVVMMAAIGLDLGLADALAGLRKWKVLALALLANLVLMPALVHLLSAALALPAGLALGLLVCAVAPGGPVGTLFARIAKADLGFALSLQVLLGVIALVSAPLSLELLGGDPSGTLLWPMIELLAVYQLLPLALGMLVRKWQPTLAKRLVRPLSLVANLLLLVIIVGLLITRGSILLTQGLGVHVVLLALVVLPLALAFVLPGGRETWLAAGFVTSVRNLTVALLLSAKFFASDPSVDVAILVWAFYMMTVPGLLAWRLGRAEPDAPARA